MKSWLDNRYFDPGDRLDVVCAGMKRLVDDLGLDYYCFRMAKHPGHVEVDFGAVGNASFPREWIEHYMRRRYHLRDPILELAVRSNRPFYWGPGRFLRSLGKAQRQVALEASAYRIVCGLAIPVHSANRSVGILNVVATDRKRLRDGAFGQQERLFAAAYDAHDFMTRTAPTQTARTRTTIRPGCESASLPWEALEPELSSRERECLLWTVEGKTAEEVGDLVGLSVHTVNRHASNAARKLGCLNKHHAAIRALRSGLL